MSGWTLESATIEFEWMDGETEMSDTSNLLDWIEQGDVGALDFAKDIMEQSAAYYQEAMFRFRKGAAARRKAAEKPA